MMYLNQGKVDMHFMYSLVDGSTVVACHLYQERYSEQKCPDSIVSNHCRLCEHGNFAPRVENRRRPRSTTPEVEEDILDVMNETHGISTRRVSTQVGVAHSTVWRLL
jgi:hypothetical protein